MFSWSAMQSSSYRYPHFFCPVSKRSPLLVLVQRCICLHFGSIAIRSRYLSLIHLDPACRFHLHNLQPFYIPQSNDAQTKAYISLPMLSSPHRRQPPNLLDRRVWSSNPSSTPRSSIPVQTSNDFYSAATSNPYTASNCCNCAMFLISEQNPPHPPGSLFVTSLFT